MSENYIDNKVETYGNDFNKPLIEPIIKNRFARKLGIYLIVASTIFTVGYHHTRPEISGEVTSKRIESEGKSIIQIRTYDNKNLNLVFDTDTDKFLKLDLLGMPDNFLGQAGNLESKLAEGTRIRVSAHKIKENRADVYKIINITN